MSIALCSLFCQLAYSQGKVLTLLFAGCSAPIMHPLPFLCNPKILQNLVYITWSKPRYIQPFLPENERACQGAGWYNASLYEASTACGLLLILWLFLRSFVWFWRR